MNNPPQRSIKVELTGDFFARKTVPKIRLQGRWLEALGFKPNGRVTVHPMAAGELMLKFDNGFSTDAHSILSAGIHRPD